MKRILALFCALLLCGSAALADSAEPVELIVFVAASMTETLTQLKADFEAVAVHIK